MSTSATPPKLPAWIFYVADLILLVTAGFIAAQTNRPFPNAAIFGIVACVIVGAILATIPRLVEYEREKNAALDERQSALEGLSQAIANSAEQISVAATGLHAIAELSHKNLRQAEQLPHKLQEKIAEFQAQLANAADSEKEELEKELAALRSSESERLESISDRIAKSVAEFSRLQSQFQKQLTAASAALAQTPSPTSPSTAVSAPIAIPSKPARTGETAPSSPPFSAESAALSKPENPSTALPAANPPRVAHREPSPAAAFVSPVTSVTAYGVPIDEPPPVKPLEIAPVVPESRPPYSERLTATAKIVATDGGATTNTPPVISTTKPPRKRPEKKSAEGTSTTETLAGLELPDTPETGSRSPVKAPTLDALVSEFTQLSPEEVNSAPALSADGATRLVVTAYIGIGNRLFIRGEGPGLSWQKGVPLHFVSIGKWRWEAADVTAPVKFKLYKNDETECVTLGPQTLAPGNQQELTAAF